LCPLNKEPFKAEGPCKCKNRSLRFKFTCPKSFRDKQGKCYHTCEDPCTDKKSGRMTYVYPDKDFTLVFKEIQLSGKIHILLELALNELFHLLNPTHELKHQEL